MFTYRSTYPTPSPRTGRILAAAHKFSSFVAAEIVRDKMHKAGIVSRFELTICRADNRDY
jgi:hypothetical protein